MCKYKKSEIEKEVARLLSGIGYQGGEVSVLAVAKYLGFRVGIVHFDTDRDGLMIVDETENSISQLTGLKATKVIMLNSKCDSKQEDLH